MYVVDMVDLKNRVAFSLILVTDDAEIHKGAKVSSMVNAYTPIALDIILSCLNDKDRRHPADALDWHIRENYKDDTNVWALGEVIEQTVRDIKRDFYGKFGYDPRLYYKLQKLGHKGNPVYRFVMDLDLTFTGFKPKEEENHDIANEVSENPSLEELNELFGQIHY